MRLRRRRRILSRGGLEGANALVRSFVEVEEVEVRATGVVNHMQMQM